MLIKAKVACCKQQLDSKACAKHLALLNIYIYKVDVLTPLCGPSSLTCEREDRRHTWVTRIPLLSSIILRAPIPLHFAFALF